MILKPVILDKKNIFPKKKKKKSIFLVSDQRHILYV